MSKEVIVEVRELSKRFGKLTALNKLNFQIYQGEIFGLLGPNGAGKSTFISVLTTLCKPTAGEVMVKNINVVRYPDRVRKYIGFVPQEVALYPMLTVEDNLNFWAGLYGLRGSCKRQRVNEALTLARLESRAGDKVDSLSGGMKRRLNIAVSLLHHPELVVMDEPTVGVDVQSRKVIVDAVRNLKEEGRTVVFASHNMEEMELLCDRVAIIDKGEMVALGALDELRQVYGTDGLEDIMLKLAEEA